jgi:hypothetical protein
MYIINQMASTRNVPRRVIKKYSLEDRSFSKRMVRDNLVMALTSRIWTTTSI